MAWNLGWSEARTSVAFLVIGVLGIVGALVAGAVMGRLGKKLTLCLFYGALAAALALLAPFAGPSPNGQLLFWMVAVVGALCWPAGSIAIWAMVPDCVEVDEFATGERREGLYSGVATFLQSAGVAVAAQLVGLTLGLAGYVETADAQPASALAAIKLTLAWAPSTLMLVTIALTVKLPMTRARHQALRTAINCRRRGESFDEEPLRELL